MNYRVISRMLGYLFLLEAVFLVPAVFISSIYKESNALIGQISTILLLLLLGSVLYFLGRRAKKNFYAREGFVIVALGWILMSAIGGLPFYISGEIPHYVDCLFETISGFTTTGASVLSNVEAMSRGLLYWRSFTHWLGGMGMLVFLLAIVPNSKEGGYSLHVLRAESPGPSVGKLVPKMKQTATILYAIYIALTLLCIIFLLCGGMPLFDSLCTAFGTAGTGGFGIKNDSLASYSPYLQGVCTVFMALFGVNFSVFYLLLMKEFKAALLDEEIRLYFGLMISSILLITWNVLPYFKNIFSAFHHAAFTVSSIMTTTGFATADFDTWPTFSKTILMILMIFGACAGSTGGGMKMVRVLLWGKSLSAELKRMLHPKSVQVVRMNKKRIGKEVLHGIDVFMTAYCLIAVLSFLLISIDNFSITTNLSATLACFNNIGPGLELVGPSSNYSFFSPFSKLILSADMLLGRLEIFPLILLCSPNTWKKA